MATAEQIQSAIQRKRVDAAIERRSRSGQPQGNIEPAAQLETAAPAIDTQEIIPTQSIEQEVVGKPKEPGFLRTLYEDITQRGEEFGKNLFIAHEELVEAGLDPVDAYFAVQKINRRTAGAIAGGAADVAGGIIGGAASLVGEIIPSAVKEPVKNAAMSLVQTQFGQDAMEAIQGGMESYSEFEKENPELAKDIKDVVNVAALFPIAKGAEALKKVSEKALTGSEKIAAGAASELTTLIPQTAKNKAKSQKLLDASLSRELATVKLKPQTVTEKIIGTERVKVVSDKSAKRAIRQGFDPAVIQSVKMGSKSDKVAMKKMVGIVEKVKDNAEFGMDNRPTDIVGDSLLKRFRVVKKTNTRAGKDIDKVVSSISKKPFDAQKIESSFIDNLSKMGISLGRDTKGDIKVNFKGSDIRGVKGLENTVKDVVERMAESPFPTTGQAHKLKKYLDTKISYDKINSGLQGKTEQLLKKLRSSVNNEIKEKSPRYAKVNKIYAETIESLDELQALAGKNNDILGEGGASMIGQKLRGIMSNNVTRTRLIKSYKDIEKLAKKYGGKFDDNIGKQVLFADELDKVFKPAGRTGFQGQIGQVLERAAQAKATGGTAEVAKGVGKLVDKIAGVNEAGAIKAIKKLLDE